MGGRWDKMALTQNKYLYYHLSSYSISNLWGWGLSRGKLLGQSHLQCQTCLIIMVRSRQCQQRFFHWCLGEKAIIHIFQRVEVQWSGQPAFKAISKQPGNYGCPIISLFCLFWITKFLLAILTSDTIAEKVE